MNKDRCKDKQFIFGNAQPRAYVRTWQACAWAGPHLFQKQSPLCFTTHMLNRKGIPKSQATTPPPRPHDLQLGRPGWSPPTAATSLFSVRIWRPASLLHQQQAIRLTLPPLHPHLALARLIPPYHTPSPMSGRRWTTVTKRAVALE
jgi:hypothetical protein